MLKPNLPRGLIVIYTVSLLVPSQVQVMVGTLGITPARFLGIVLIGSLLRRYRLSFTAADLLVSLFFLAKLISFAFSASGFRAAEAIGREVSDVLPAYLLGRIVAQEVDYLDWFMNIVVGLLALMTFTLLLESFGHVNVHYELWGLLWSSAIAQRGRIGEERLGLRRAMAWTRHPIMLGMTYASLVAFSLATALGKGKTRPYLVWVRFCALMVGVFLSFSSGAWITATTSVVMVIYDHKTRVPSKSKWALLLAAALCIYAGIAVLADNPPLMVIMYRTSWGGGWLYRWQLWERVIESMSGHWVLGYGGHAPPEFANPDRGWSIDNNYLVTLLMGGLLGLALWIGIQSIVLYYNIRYCWLNPDSPLTSLGRAFGFSIIASLIGQFSVAMFSTAIVMLWMLFGLALGTAVTARGHTNKSIIDKTYC